MHGHKESYKDLNLKNFDLRVGLEPTTSLMLYQLSYQGSDESSQYFGILFLGYWKRYRSEMCTGYLYGCT